MSAKNTVVLEKKLLADLRRLTGKRASATAANTALREYLSMWRQVEEKYRGKKNKPKIGTWGGLAELSRVLRENGWETTPRHPQRGKK